MRMKAATFVAGVSAVAYAAGTATQVMQTNKAFDAVEIVQSSAGTHFTATDGYRIASVLIEEAKGDDSVLISARQALDLAKKVGGKKRARYEVSVVKGELHNALAFGVDCHEFAIYSKTPFPDWQRVAAREGVLLTSVDLPRAPFLAAAKAMDSADAVNFLCCSFDTSAQPAGLRMRAMELTDLQLVARVPALGNEGTASADFMVSAQLLQSSLAHFWEIRGKELDDDRVTVSWKAYDNSEKVVPVLLEATHAGYWKQSTWIMPATYSKSGKRKLA